MHRLGQKALQFGVVNVVFATTLRHSSAVDVPGSVEQSIKVRYFGA